MGYLSVLQFVPESFCILAFRPSHQTACSRTGSRPLQTKFSESIRSNGQTVRLRFFISVLVPSHPFSIYSFPPLTMLHCSNTITPLFPTVSFGAWRMKLKIDCRGRRQRRGWMGLRKNAVDNEDFPPIQTSTPWQSKQFASSMLKLGGNPGPGFSK